VREKSGRKLLKAIRKGQRQACEELICRHYETIYRFLAYLTCDAALAEELTQETFAAAWAAIIGYRGRASPATWLHRIAYGKFIDYKRKLRRRTDAMASLRQKPAAAAQTCDPVTHLMAEEDVRLLLEAMTALDCHQYGLILLHYVQGLSYRQMAKVLSEPAGTVKWRTSRALSKLRQCMTGRT
jgi:RNA polymerase sigma-70 factor (ECF subfamily)